MDFVSTERALRAISDNQRKLCRKYAEDRHKYGEAKFNLRMLLIPHQEEDHYRKASFDKQINMLLSDTPENHKTEVYKYVEDYDKCRENYKGREQMIKCNSEEISWTQSMLRYSREND